MFNTGKYLLRFYTKYGQKIKDMDEVCVSYLQAVEQGDEIVGEVKRLGVVEENTPLSFSVDRRVYNSLDCKGV